MYVVVNLITDLPYFYIDAAFEKPDSKDHEALPDATGINRDVLVILPAILSIATKKSPILKELNIAESLLKTMTS